MNNYVLDHGNVVHDNGHREFDHVPVIWVDSLWNNQHVQNVIQFVNPWMIQPLERHILAIRNKRNNIHEIVLSAKRKNKRKKNSH